MRKPIGEQKVNGTLLFLISAVWSTINLFIRRLLHRGFLKPAVLDCRVISVGNLQAGGSGKTPLVAKIANEAVHKKLRVCIMTRGYKSRFERRGGAILPKADPSYLEPTPEDFGDEAVLLHDLCPASVIAVGSDRLAQYEKLRQTGYFFDLVILDDGFQNWRIKKDLEIVAVTSSSRFDRLFREWDIAIEDANLVVWTKGIEVPPLINNFKHPVVKVHFALPYVQHDQKILLVSGVGDSKGVLKSVKDAGYDILTQVNLPDHADYNRYIIDTLFREAERNEAKVAITGKDWVKWRRLDVKESEVIILEPEIIIDEGEDVWRQAIWES